jgi:Ca2+-transporting ATPase
MDASADEPSPEWHTLSIDATMSHLQSTPHGLAEVEVERRFARYGPNELQAAGRVSPWVILFQQFKNVLIIILLIATGISAFLGEGVETIAIAVIVLFAVVLGFIQEYRAERAIEALRQMAAPTVTVIRDGREIEIPALELVPGDVIQESFPNHPRRSHHLASSRTGEMVSDAPTAMSQSSRDNA